MSLWKRLFGKADASGPRVRPESLRSILVMADDSIAEPKGDPMELVMRVFHAQNRAMFAAVLERDLWEQIQLGFGRFAHEERTDPQRLAALVRKSHGEGVTATAQAVRYALAKDREPSDLTLLTIHRAERGESLPPSLAPTSEPIVPRLDLTSPVVGRDR